jgi:hypothetical protein
MLYLTYNIINNESDGMGAQYQRIIGIIAIANYYNYKYVHSPIIHMEHIDNIGYLDKIEQFFQIINNYPNVNSFKYDNIYEEFDPSNETLINYNEQSTNKNILIKIQHPYKICDMNPFVYKKVMPILSDMIINKYLPFYKNDNKIKIAIHVRRGNVDNQTYNDRYTSLNDIINVINSLKIKYHNCSFYIFTQIDEKNKNEFDIFNNDKTIQIKANEDQLLTLNHLINADILVMCKSSFSYIAGLYNRNIVYYFDFWHSPLDNWINIKKLNYSEEFTNILNLGKSNNNIIPCLIILSVICWIIFNKNKNALTIGLISLLIIISYYLLKKETFDNNGMYTAVIIEPRKHNALEFVLTNFTYMLDNRWNFIIFHGNQNKNYINDIISTKLINHINRIKLINLNVDNLTIHDYNVLLYNPLFYTNIPTEIFLIFQTDTLICDKFKNTIYKFIENDYDYIGAPYLNKTIGNGGLSLRKKSKMLEIISKCGDRKQFSPQQLHNEDAFFSQVCNDRVNIKLPSFEDAKEFSIETVYSDKSFGIHKAWEYQDAFQLMNINKFCSGILDLIKLQ